MDPLQSVRIEPWAEGRALPLVVTPRAGAVDLAAFAGQHGSWIDDRLRGAGALLFRGFGVDSPPALQAFAQALSPDLPRFAEESSPRSQVLGAVSTSTDYPRDYPIQFHNEYSYAGEWPGKLYFCCLAPPERGGATPLADSRRVLARLGAATRARFAEKGVLYVRNFQPRIGVRWETAFQTSEPAAVERYCREAGIEFAWKPGGRLTTRQRGPATAVHPRTGEEVWFNHALFFNVRGLEPAPLREAFLKAPEELLSTNTYYGDGSRIEDGVIEEIRAAYRAEARSFRWERGDVLLIDNMLAAHAREPFSGERRIVVVMAERIKRA